MPGMENKFNAKTFLYQSDPLEESTNEKRNDLRRRRVKDRRQTHLSMCPFVNGNSQQKNREKLPRKDSGNRSFFYTTNR